MDDTQHQPPNEPADAPVEVTVRGSEAARRLAREQQEEAPESAAARAAERGLAIANTVEELSPDEEIVTAAILYPLVECGAIAKKLVAERFGADTARLVRELLRLGAFGMPERLAGASGLPAQQAEGLRKMLFAIVADVRVVLVRLADQLHRMRSLKYAEPAAQMRAATETREIYAPLANRLGIWQVKWELEDLAFRFLEPDTYREIAAWLQERRADREVFIQSVIAQLQEALERAGVEARIEGRPKHIYSIWRKMRRKDLPFEHIFDVRAVRVLADDTAACYAALGVVHGMWHYIPGEFDDYIATPKENNYQSLHTAVIGPGGKTLEVQIRSHDMHEHAELGVAAHWRYKEGGHDDKAFREKVNWLRQLLEPSDDPVAETETDFIDRFKAEIFEDRVYVLTPGGDVVDLPGSSTPVDFAYHVHTELGNRCRGARVNGRLVSLTHPLANGDQIEIITSRRAKPSRDWLIPQAGYLVSSRARSKVRHWFRRHEQEQNLGQGQAMLERELQRLGVDPPPITELAKELNANSATELYVAVGAGDVTLAEVAKAIQRLVTPPQPEILPLEPSRRPRKQRTPSDNQIDIDGVGDLLTNLANCCRPVPPDAISGYVTRGRGVTIHRADCANMLRLLETDGERCLAVNWREDQPSTYPVNIRIEAYDRKGLVKDISTILATDKVNILSMQTWTDKAALIANFDLTIEISGLQELSGVLHRLSSLSNVHSVRRSKPV